MGYYQDSCVDKAKIGRQHPIRHPTISWKLELVRVYTIPKRDSSEMQSYMSLLASTGTEPNSPKQSSYTGMNPCSGSSSFPDSLFLCYSFVTRNLGVATELGSPLKVLSLINEMI